MTKQSTAKKKPENVTEAKTDVNPIVADGHNLEQIQKDHNVSGAIRYLSGLGYERKHIAKFLNKRYQHVRNVLITPLKGEIKKTETETKADEKTKS